MAPAVHLRSAVALAGRFPALAGVDLSVDPGEVVALVGHNGAGKTSVLRACAGLLPLCSGEAVVLGFDLREDPTTVRRSVGLLGHAAPLYDELTTVENVRFAVKAARRDRAQIDAALERLALVGRVRRTQVGRLSAGQRRKVALACLMAKDPDLWLLDEPHAGLDAGARRTLNELVAGAAEKGAAVLMASHELDVARATADRVVTMAGGRVVDHAATSKGLAEGGPAEPLPTAISARSHGGRFHVA